MVQKIKSKTSRLYSLNYHITFLITVGIFQYCILKLLQPCVSQISTFINCLFTTIINTEFIYLLKMAIFHGFLYFTICILKNKQINKYKILIIALLQFTSNFMPFKNLRHQLLIKSCCKNNGWLYFTNEPSRNIYNVFN